jgi:hypothetical protein
MEFKYTKIAIGYVLLAISCLLVDRVPSGFTPFYPVIAFWGGCFVVWAQASQRID